MSDAAMDVLRENLAGLQASLRWLRRSYDACSTIGLKDSYSDEEFDAFENLSSRYARTTDLIVGKVLRSIDAVEFLDAGSIIDAANRAEKRGIIDSVEALRVLKDLRNEVAHEYEADDLKGLFGAILASSPEVMKLAERIFSYCDRFQMHRGE